MRSKLEKKVRAGTKSVLTWSQKKHVAAGIFVLDVFGLDEFRMRADLLSTKYRNKTRPLCDRWERKTSKLAKSIPKMFFILAKVQALDRN